MKRLLEILFILCLSCGISNANILKQLGCAVSADFNLLKTDVGKNMEAVAKVEGRIDKIEFRVGRIEVDAKVNATGQMGVNNKAENTNSTEKIGGNKVSTVTNEGSLIQYIFQGLFALMTAICIALITTIRAQNNHIKNLVNSSQAKDTKIYELANQNIKILLDIVDDSNEILLDIVRKRMDLNGLADLSGEPRDGKPV